MLWSRPSGTANRAVSVLFSEPKILNPNSSPSKMITSLCFSALQRAENSQCGVILAAPDGQQVSVLFSEPKILNRAGTLSARCGLCVSVLFSEPKILNNWSENTKTTRSGVFQCSSASRKFSIPTLAPASIHISDRDDHASSFLSLPGASP